MAWTSQGTRDILRDTGYALVDTVGTRAKKPQELNQGALGFLGFDKFPMETQEGARQKTRDFQRRIADFRVGFLAEGSCGRAPTVSWPGP